MTHLQNEWDNLLKDETQKDYMNQLRDFLRSEYSTKNIFPKMSQIFNALQLTDYDDVKVVIIGQDPYHEKNQAMGLSFSVPDGIRIPPSLQNIYKEIEATIGRKQPQSGDLTRWAKQGVLLLNSTLTVIEGRAASHRGKGWEEFTDYIIKLINQKQTPVVFMLWGNDAKRKKVLITNPIHTVLTAAHPSPLSAYNGFFGCNHFNLANEALTASNQAPIEW